jgi:hypothetical protein
VTVRRRQVSLSGEWQWIRRRSFLRMRGPRRIVAAMALVGVHGPAGRIGLGRRNLGPVPLPFTHRKRHW